MFKYNSGVMKLYRSLLTMILVRIEDTDDVCLTIAADVPPPEHPTHQKCQKLLITLLAHD